MCTLQTGVELDVIPLPRAAVPDAVSGVVTVREVGAPMLPMWPSYYAECRAVVYVIDTSQPMAVSSALVELLDVVSHPLLGGKPILIVLNKWCVPHAGSCDVLCVLNSLQNYFEPQ